MIFFKILICSLLFIDNSFSMIEDLRWELINSGDGIEVYGPVDFVHESGITPIKMIATIDYPVVTVLTALADTEKKSTWIPSMKNAKRIETVSLYSIIEQVQYHAPWPLKDREFVYKSKARIDLEKKMIEVKMNSIKDDKAPLNDEHVRGEMYESITRIIHLTPTQTRLELYLMNDFKGSIPKWIINIIQKKWPYNFMKHLRQYLANNKVEPLEKFKKLPF